MLRVKRVSLMAGIKTGISPPSSFHNLSVGNATTDDLELHTTDDNDLEFLVIEAGFERPIPTSRRLFSYDSVAFWLKAKVSGTAVLLWY